MDMMPNHALQRFEAIGNRGEGFAGGKGSPVADRACGSRRAHCPWRERRVAVAASRAPGR
jgi:hypothetical protein